MISVIIPSYNRANTILRAVNSVLNQTYSDIELIIVDDCSTDNTEEIISGINDDRVQYIKNDKNLGACKSRNNGVAVAKGEYIAFQDSDDCWRSSKLEHQLAYMEKLNADVCFCRFEKHGYPEVDGKITPNIPGGIISYDSLIRHSIVGTPTILAKAEVCRKIPFDYQLNRLQDYDWTILAGKKYRFCLDDEVLLDAYLQRDSLTNSSNYYNSITALLEKYRKQSNDYKEVIPILLNKQANINTFNGKRSYKSYVEAYRMTNEKQYLAKSILSFMGLLRIIFKIKGITY